MEGRTGDLKPCSSGIGKTQEKMGAPGEKEETGDPTDHSCSQVGTLKTESRLYPDDLSSGHRKFWEEMETRGDRKKLGHSCCRPSPQAVCRAPSGLTFKNSVVTTGRPGPATRIPPTPPSSSPDPRPHTLTISRFLGFPVFHPMTPAARRGHSDRGCGRAA